VSRLSFSAHLFIGQNNNKHNAYNDTIYIKEQTTQLLTGISGAHHGQSSGITALHGLHHLLNACLAGAFATWSESSMRKEKKGIKYKHKDLLAITLQRGEKNVELDAMYGS